MSTLTLEQQMEALKQQMAALQQQKDVKDGKRFYNEKINSDFTDLRDAGFFHAKKADQPGWCHVNKNLTPEQIAKLSPARLVDLVKVLIGAVNGKEKSATPAATPVVPPFVPPVATPVTAPAATPVATPAATPAATPVVPPVATPVVPTPPLPPRDTSPPKFTPAEDKSPVIVATPEAQSQQNVISVQQSPNGPVQQSPNAPVQQSPMVPVHPSQTVNARQNLKPSAVVSNKNKSAFKF